MSKKENAPERERRDWTIILIILLVGFLCVILAGEQALRFAPNWKLNTSMDSNINPDNVFLTSRPNSLIEPLDPSILTPPAWFDVFLTPGAIVNTLPPAPTSTPISTLPNPSLPANTSLPTNTIVPTITAPPTNTPFIIIINPTKTPRPIPPDTSTPIPPNTPTLTPQPVADLSITITDNSSDYVAGQYKLFPNVFPYSYVITVSNAGPSNVSGATVSNVFSNGNIDPASVIWVCSPSAGASCNLTGLLGNNLNNEPVNLNSGSSVTFYLAAQVVSSPSGSLINTVTVTAPVGVSDSTPLNNSKTDTDQLVVVNGTVDSTPGSSVTNYLAGSYVTLQFGTPLVVGSGSYLVYYPEYPNPPADPTLQMDLVILQIGDGSNWYTVFNWGNGSPDANTDIIPASPPNTVDCTSETDNCPIDVALLTINSPYPGVTINIPASVPAGTYPYIRIISPPGGPSPLPMDSGDGLDVDAIQVLP